MTIICPKCEIELRVTRCGESVESMTMIGPYKLLSGDRYGCPSCGLAIVTNFGTPISEQFREDYAESVERWKPTVRYWMNQREKDEYLQASHFETWNAS